MLRMCACIVSAAKYKDYTASANMNISVMLFTCGAALMMFIERMVIL